MSKIKKSQICHACFGQGRIERGGRLTPCHNCGGAGSIKRGAKDPLGFEIYDEMKKDVQK